MAVAKQAMITSSHRICWTIFKHIFLVLVNAFLKWPEVIEMSSSTTARTIEALSHVFVVHGLSEQLVSDNGAQFISDEFTLFMKENGIKHFKSAPYHPATNGLAEHFILKEGYESWDEGEGTVETMSKELPVDLQNNTMKQYHDDHSRVRMLAIGDKVIAKNF